MSRLHCLASARILQEALMERNETVVRKPWPSSDANLESDSVSLERRSSRQECKDDGTETGRGIIDNQWDLHDVALFKRVVSALEIWGELTKHIDVYDHTARLHTLNARQAIKNGSWTCISILMNFSTLFFGSPWSVAKAFVSVVTTDRNSAASLSRAAAVEDAFAASAKSEASSAANDSAAAVSPWYDKNQLSQHDSTRQCFKQRRVPHKNREGENVPTIEDLSYATR